MEFEKMVDLLGGNICGFCTYYGECPEGVVCYGGNPIEPPCCNGDYESIIDFDEMMECLTEEGLIMPNIKGIWFNQKKGITVVKWEDDSITKVSTQNNEKFDSEKGIALCFMKKMCGNTGKYNEILKQYIHDNSSLLEKG